MKIALTTARPAAAAPAEPQIIVSRGREPEALDRIYFEITRKKLKSGDYFNGAVRDTYAVTINANELRWTAPETADHLEALEQGEDVAELTINASRVTLDRAISLPGCKVTVIAAEIVWKEGFKTSPKPVAGLPEDPGKPTTGQKGGDVTLIADIISFFDNTAARAYIDASGGRGQHAAPPVIDTAFAKNRTEMQVIPFRDDKPKTSRIPSPPLTKTGIDRDVPVLSIGEDRFVLTGQDSPKAKYSRDEQEAFWWKTLHDGCIPFRTKPLDEQKWIARVVFNAFALLLGDRYRLYSKTLDAWEGKIVQIRVEDEATHVKKAVYEIGTATRVQDGDVETERFPGGEGGDGGKISLHARKIVYGGGGAIHDGAWVSKAAFITSIEGTDGFSDPEWCDPADAAGGKAPLPFPAYAFKADEGYPGEPGRPPEDPGTPNPAVYITVHLKIEGTRREGISPNLNGIVSEAAPARHLPYPEVKKRGADGTLTLAGPEKSLSAQALEKAFAFAADLFEQGYIARAAEAARRLDETLLPLAAEVPQDLALRLREMRQRLASNQNYLGYPLNWAPRLSVATSLGIYEAEVGRSLRAIAAAFLLRRIWTEATARHDSLSHTIGAMGDAFKATEESLAALHDKATSLNNQLARIKDQNWEVLQAFYGERDRLMNKTEDEYRRKQVLQAFASATRIVSKVLAAFPIGKPYTEIAAGATSIVGNVLDAAAGDDPEKAVKGAGETLAKFQKTYGDKIVALATRDIKGPLGKANRELDELRNKFKAYSTNFKDGEVKGFLNAEAQLKEAKNALEKQKKTYTQRANNVMAGIAAAGEIVPDVVDLVKTISAPKDEVDKEVGKIFKELADADIPYQTLSQMLSDLAARKEAWLAKILDTSAEIDAALSESQLLLVNQTALLDQLGEENDLLDPRVERFLGTLDDTARARLQKYLVMLVKAYEYFSLEPFNAMDLRLSELTAAVTAFLEKGGTGAPPAPDALFNVLSAAFEDVTARIGERVFDRLDSGIQRARNTLPVEFTPEQVETLDATGRLRFNLAKLGYSLPRTDVRISRICISKGSRFEMPVDRSASALFTIKHSGVSVIEKSGARFEFVSRSDTEKVRWTSSYDPVTGAVTEDTPDDLEEALFSRLFDAHGSGGHGHRDDHRSVISLMAPGFFSDFEISMAPSLDDVTIGVKALKLEIDYIAQPL